MNPTRHCLDGTAIRHLRRDGIGWGRDLDYGCFDSAPRPVRSGLLRGLLARFGKRS
ncbi:MAG: hypothetical protein GVY31_14940 [Alphaproteobacteria bacterium]|nr:hypothetical protein [Alphaproteobacteria bacterium]